MSPTPSAPPSKPSVMSMDDYVRYLRRIWAIGFIAILFIMGVIKWRAHIDGEATRTPAMDALLTVGIALLIPTLIVVRGYFRFKKWRQSQPTAS